MQPRTLAIVGVGLIGGSVGLAVRRPGGGTHVVGVDRDDNALRCARERGAVDEARSDFPAAVAAADLVLFCTPVDSIASQVLAAASACRPGTVLTDAGSTKAAIVDAVESHLPASVAFVGGHPLAGSEKQGPEYADPALFRDRVVVLTPTATSDEQAVARVAAFWESLGARVRRMSPDAHDRALALTSHLPHLVAAALAGVLPPELAGLTASGFRDTTRLAASNPELWSAILDANREAVLDALALFQGQLREFRRALEAGDRDAVRAALEAGGRARSALRRDT
jgi:prephenate dehydrogenase